MNPKQPFNARVKVTGRRVVVEPGEGNQKSALAVWLQTATDKYREATSSGGASQSKPAAPSDGEWPGLSTGPAERSALDLGDGLGPLSSDGPPTVELSPESQAPPAEQGGGMMSNWQQAARDAYRRAAEDVSPKPTPPAEEESRSDFGGFGGFWSEVGKGLPGGGS